MALGLAAGITAGILVAFTIAAIPRLGRLVWPMVLVLQAFPVFVLAPILVLWFGFGMASKVVMTAIIIFFPVASSFTDGLNRTERAILDAASLTKASHWQVLTRLRVPLALPSLISGLRVAAPLAPLGAVIGEWVGASAGLGFVMIQSNARMQTDTMFAAMAILAVMAVLLRLIVDLSTAHLAPWAKETEHTTPFRYLRRLSAP
ncbi:putative aliphatic sulfonates transport permease protein SsuC [compost metagenome]